MQLFKLAVCVLIAALAACASNSPPRVANQSPPPAVAPPGSKQVHEKTVTTDEGPFQFTGLSILRDYFGARVVGKVTNNTPKRWNNASFDVVLVDVAGNKLGSKTLEFSDIAPGQTKPIGGILEAYGEKVSLKDANQISGFDLKFSGGSIFATYVFVLSKPAATNQLNFSDDAIDIQFSPSKKQLGFLIRNKNPGPAKIDWNSAAYVDTAGVSHKVMHDGIKFTDRSNVQAPTVIPPGAGINDLVYPIDYAYYVTGQYGGWTELPLFPEAPKAKAYKGQTFGVFLPIEIHGKIRNYNFVFTIKDVTT